MAQPQKHLDQAMDEMRAVAEHLIPYTHPNVDRLESHEVDVLKQRTIYVDGYELVLHFGLQNFTWFRIERLEVIGLHAPFLPMYVVCKIASKFLGGNELRYSESFKMGRKVYVWTVAIDQRGRPVVFSDPDFEKCSYEHFDYSHVTDIR